MQHLEEQKAATKDTPTLIFEIIFAEFKQSRQDWISPAKTGQHHQKKIWIHEQIIFFLHDSYSFFLSTERSCEAQR
jgi:hypothetical protein